MSTFLIVTRRHGLMPLANRLRREGHEVQICIYNRKGRSEKYSNAYGGVFDFVGGLDDSDWDEKLEGLQALAADGKCIVVTDSSLATEKFKDAAYLYGHCEPPKPETRNGLRIGCWVQNGEVHAPHLLVVDRGAWPGGFGPMVDAGMTMIRIDEMDEIPFDWDQFADPSFSGLCSQDVAFTDDGLHTVGPVVRGWHALHDHCFFSQIAEPSVVLDDGASPALPTKFTVAAALSQPPWPNAGQGSQRMRSPVEGFTADLSGYVMWHDVEADAERQQMVTLGLDGLVGVVHAGGHSFELARQKVVDVCAMLRFPAKQFRPDVGAHVREIIGFMEQNYQIDI